MMLSLDQTGHLPGNIIRNHVPLRRVLPRKYPCWFTPQIITAIRIRNSLYRRLKHKRTLAIEQEYRQCRTQCRNMTKRAFREYIKEIETSLGRNPAGLWDFIRSRKRNTRIPGMMCSNGECINNPKQIADAFGRYFESMYQTSSVRHTFTESNSDIIVIANITPEEVISVAKQMRPNCTMGDDGIPSFLVHDCIGLWASLLANIFNDALSQCIFPNRWKVSRIVPILKSGDKSQINNYRPISIVSVFGKIFEKIWYSRLFFMIKNRISPKQHGFFPGRSTATNLISTTEIISHNMNELIQSDVIYTDFKRAFDSVDHALLLHKLAKMGVSRSLVELLCSYLTNRSMYVFYNGAKSLVFSPTSGVPQGANLGTLLFSVFINDIVEELGSNVLLFADDLKLFSSIRCLQDTVDLQEQLHRLSRWCNRNRIQLNVQKCAVISFSRSFRPIAAVYMINGEVLTRVTKYKDLGVTFQSDLSFCLHFSTIISDASKTLGFIMRNFRDFSNVETLKIIFCSLVRSKLEYCSTVWSTYDKIHIESLEAVQRKFLKFLHFKECGEYPARGVSQTGLLSQFGLQSLYFRRRIQDMMFLRGLVCGKTDCRFLLEKLDFYVPRLNSTARATFYVKSVRTDYFKYAPINRICREANKLASNIDIFHSSKVNIIQYILAQSEHDQLQ